MEEPRATTLQGQPKPPNPEGAEPVAVTANAPVNKKRKPDSGGFHDSDFVKVRALVKELRPFFMEVLHTPDFRNSKAAYEIQKRMKTMMELTKRLTETTSTSKPDKVHDQLLHGAVMEQNENKTVVVEKQTAQPQPQPSEALASGTVTKQKVDSKILKSIGAEVSRGTFVVGGSPVGWNFLLYPGTELVYYGRTKESVLASRASK